MMTDYEVSVRLTWRVICGLACKALILGLTFNEVCELALRDHMGASE